MNTNMIHNILNVLFGIIGVLLATDFTTFGVDPEAAVRIAGSLMIAQNIIKVGMNITRDGITGLVKKQPPVQG